jgi:methyl-accepting chemotaxis protein
VVEPPSTIRNRARGGSHRRHARSILRELRIGVRQNLGPVSDRARTISDNVESITDTLRTEVRHLRSSVRAINDRLEQASDHMEDRIEEFNALLEAVQAEAEDIFLDTAATVHGLREGARAIGRNGKQMQEPPETDPEDDSGARRRAGDPIGRAAADADRDAV